MRRSIPRIIKSTDFQRVLQKGLKYRAQGFVMAYTQPKNTGSIGYIASRKVGNAVARNKAKRRLRALVNLYADSLFAQQRYADVVFIAKNTITSMDYTVLKSDFFNAIKRACKS